MLTRLQKKYSDKPVRFLLFPCNQFGEQEPGTNAEIKKFAEQYVALAKDGGDSNVIMFAKSNLNGVACTYSGEDACMPGSKECCAENDAVYTYLLANTPPGTIAWNFDKIITDSSGKPYAGEVIMHGGDVDAAVSNVVDSLLEGDAPNFLALPDAETNIGFPALKPKVDGFPGLTLFEGRRQAARLVDLFSSRSAEDDLGIIVGDFGAVSGPFGSDYPEEAEAPLQTLEDVGWSLVYDKDAVPASCLFGFLADFMATSQKVTPRSVEALATADVIGEAQLEVPISDHKAIKVACPLPALVASRTKPIAASGLQELPVIGFGSHFMPEDLTERVSDQDFYRRVDELTQAALQEALAAGVRLVDSSNRHMNQQSIGRALETALKQEALTRGEVFLCGRISKCKDREQVRCEVDMLLRELQVDYVDLLVADCPPEQVPAAWPWIEEVAREGRTRFLGVSNFDLLGPKVCVEVFRKFLAGVKMPPAVLAMEVHPLNTNEEMSDLCQSMGIQVLAYSPLGAPHKVETYLKVLTKSDAREMRPLLKVPELQLLQSIANRHDATAAQVALRWNLQRGHCIVPKSWNPNHILENTKLFSFKLTMEEMASITKLNKGVRSERFFQASFSTAAKALPQMTRDAHDECRKILNKIRGPGGSVLEPGSVPQGLEPVPLPEGVARRGGDDGGLTGKVDWEKLGFHRPVEEFSAGEWD
ncbi:AKR1D1 [Symbiodinium sp. CCMP2592]|nr:AKR1D1 [Symbiodinium sp. CCMP2592]